jgi:hypothetical protein
LIVTDLSMPMINRMTFIRGADMQSLNSEAQRRDLSIRLAEIPIRGDGRRSWQPARGQHM